MIGDSQEVVSHLELVCVFGFQNEMLLTVADKMCAFEADQMDSVVEGSF